MLFEPYKGYSYGFRDLIRKGIVPWVTDKVTAYAAAEVACWVNWEAEDGPYVPIWRGNDPACMTQEAYRHPEKWSRDASIVWERVHYGLSHHVVGVSKTLGQILLQQQMEDVHLDHLRLPFRIFELCPEKGILLSDGRQMPSLLVILNPSGAEKEAFAKEAGKLYSKFQSNADKIAGGYPFARRVDEESLALLTNGKANMSHMENSVMILWAMGQFSPQADPSLRDIPCDCPILQCVSFVSDVHQSIESILAFQAAKPKDNRTLHSEIEDEMQAAALRLTLASLCYLNCDDAQVTVLVNRERPKLGAVPPQAILLGRDEKYPVGCHLRSGHFRALAHERFHRNPDGSIRIVWVRPSLVNADNPAAQPPAKEHALP